MVVRMGRPGAAYRAGVRKDARTGAPGSACLSTGKLHSGKSREQGIPVEELTIRNGWDPIAILGLRRIIKREHINIVNTHSGKDTWVGGLAAKLSGATFVRTRHLSIPISNSPLNFIHRLADGTITTGVSIREAMITNNGISRERIISIATGVNAQRFNPDRVSKSSKLQAELGLKPGAPVVTMVAVLRGMKRHDVLLNAARIVRSEAPDAQFLIVGDGPGRDGLKQLACELGLDNRAIFCGHRSDVPQILALSDIAVLTSDRFEGVPQSLSQAMAMALPVVASPIGSIPELVRNGATGLFAEPGNPESFANAIIQLLRDRDMRQKLGAAARRHILEHYTDDIMARTTVDFYARISGQTMIQAPSSER